MMFQVEEQVITHYNFKFMLKKIGNYEFSFVKSFDNNYDTFLIY